MNIAIALNKKFLRYGYVMLTSLFENNKDEDISVTVLHRGLTEADFRNYMELAGKYGQRLSPLEITEEMIPSGLPSTEKWPIEVYFRLMLPFLLPESVERLLYLDTDIIVGRPLKELYEIDLSGNLMAAVPDNSDGNLSDLQNRIFEEIIASDRDFHYMNSGVLLMDIKALRDAYTPEGFVDTAVKLKDLITAFDQDIINYMFHGRIKSLPAEKYNLFARLFYNSGYDYRKVKAAGTVIIHYTGPKPWSGVNLRTDMEKFWWEYAVMTPYYHEFLEELVMAEIENGFENTNEFKYQLYQREQLLDEIDALRARAKEYEQALKDCSALLQKLGGTPQ
ncbi:MAG: glycosyltransferase family 8 protein [Lachnospiraceae bacterium]|nr:glycosyltransferase family 8 protein [Lachnospiraceae bacterium]